ncbi:MAG: tetratricopeptide repeat protein [Pseudonocardiaceae bacterium]
MTLYCQLDAAVQRRVCLVIAGAGWGKTTALAAWADAARTAWLTLDAGDARLGRLLRHLVAALRVYLPALSLEVGHSDRDDGDHGWESLLADVCEQLDKQLRDDLVFVLDDLQELPAHSAAARFVEGLCRHAPEALHLVLCSRVEPPFSVERLRGQGHLTEIDATQLTFDVDDVATLLRITLGDEASGLATRVWRKTAGWPTVTCFAAEAMRGIDPERRLDAVAQLTRPGGRLSTYLIEEVLDQEPEQVREVLRRVAVLGEVSLPVARALGVEDPERLLADLTRRGLVRSTAGSAVSWSVLRPLRDCVDKSVIPEAERAMLHCTAAKELAAGGSYATALQHLITGGDHGGVAALLVEHGTTLVSTGEINAVLAAAQLPAGWLDDPRVQRVIGHAQQVSGQWTSALEYFQRTTRDQEELQPALAWRMGLGLYARGEFDKALAMYGRARLDREDTADEAQLLAWTASASRMVGDYDRCRELGDRAVAAADRCHDLSARAAGYSALTLLAAAQGDPLHTDEYGSIALNAAKSADDLLEIVRIRAFRAMHLLARGQPADGLREAEIAHELSERCGHRLGVALALTHRGTARARLGQLDDALGDFVTARDVFQDMGSRFVAWPLNGLGSVHRIRGQLAQARAAYEEALAVAEPCPEVLGLAGALTGLARTRAADDIPAARELAERAVAVGEGLCYVQALLSRAWIALLAGDREAASEDSARAAELARSGRDNPGLAESLELTVLASVTPTESAGLLDEAVAIWRDAGYPVEEAEARLIAAHLSKGGAAGAGAPPAERSLQDRGIRLAAGLAAGPLAVVQARSAPSVSIRALGAFQVFRNGVPVPAAEWQSKRARDLVKILVSRRRAVPREQLTELLWPDEDPAKLGNRLSVLLSTVRSILDPGRDRQAEGSLCTDGTSVWLVDVDIDVDEFLATATAALDADARAEPDALSELLAAESRYTGAFLEDDPYHDWAATVGEDVRATYLAVLRALSSRLRHEGGTDRAVRYTLRLLSEDHYDEAAHLELVAILLEAGRLGEARRRYELYTRQISELGVTPQPFPGLTNP